MFVAHFARYVAGILQADVQTIEELAQLYHHKIAFWGEIDRQFVQTFGNTDDMRNAVRRLANAFFKYGRTGFVAQCLYTTEENKAAEWDEWQKISEKFA